MRIYVNLTVTVILMADIFLISVYHAIYSTHKYFSIILLYVIPPNKKQNKMLYRKRKFNPLVLFPNDVLYVNIG